jgi:transposase-like protein
MGGRASWGESRWREVLRRFDASGLSISEFCRREGCSPPTFYQWRKRLASRPPSDRPSPTFAQFILPPVPEQRAAIEIQLPDQTRIALHGPVDREQLGAVLACLARGERC